MTARQNYYAESLSETALAGSSYTDKLTLTFTPDDGGTYFILASALLQSSSNAATRAFCRLLQSTSATTLQELINEPIVVGDYIAFAGLAVEAFGIGPGSQSYKIQFRNSDAVQTTRIKNAAAIAIKKDAADGSVESLSESTTTAATPQTKAELSITPASTGDYLIIAAADVIPGGSSAQDVIVDLDVDGAAQYGAFNRRRKDLSEAYYNWAAIARVSLSAASHSIKIRWRQETVNVPGVSIRNARIIALRWDRFAAAFHAAQRTRSTTTNTSPQDFLTLTDTPAAEDHLVIANARIDSDSAAQQAICDLAEDGVAGAEMRQQPQDITNNSSFFALYRKTYAAASVDWTLRCRAATSNTVGMDEAVIAAMELNVAEGGGPGVAVGMPIINVISG